MRKSWILVVIFLGNCMTRCTSEGASSETAQEVLNKAIQAISPVVSDQALLATMVRTHYATQKLEDYSDNAGTLEIQRTTISEIIVNSEKVKESICDSRKVGTLLKQYEHRYSDNGKYIKAYEPRENAGVVRKSLAGTKNNLSIVFSPYTSVRQGRFVSRGMPILFSRLKRAKVTSQKNSKTEGFDSIILEGKYELSDPEHYFKITLIPEFNYAVTSIEEYDKNNRILSSIVSSNFEKMFNTFLPKSTQAQKYKYDDYEGNTIQVSKLEVLTPKILESVSDELFSFDFPVGAKLYDSTLDVEFGRTVAIDNVLDSAIEDLVRAPLSKGVKGKEIVERAKKAYKLDKESTTEILIPTEKKSKVGERELQMPRAHLPIVLKMLGTLIAICIILSLIFVLKKRKEAVS